jgi:DNA polymerase-1
MLRLRFDENDRQQVASARRYGVNMPIQGTSADILKRSLRLLHESLRETSGQLVNNVHDEVNFECDAAEAEATEEKMDRSRCAAGEEFISKVPVKVDVHIADEWSR